ncbi:MAG: hypothetical protein WDM96_16035 [Lacunisphaera sp.]
MNLNAPSPLPWPVAARDEAGLAPATAWLRPASVVALLAGLLTAFTVSVVGEMPLGELALFAVSAWVALCVIVHRTRPGPLFRHRYLGVLLAGQAAALLAYVLSDFYRHSAPADMARGWARMVFLGIDVIAVTYLFGRARAVFYWFLVGVLAGDLANSLLFGALFGDAWKFGYGLPLTYAAILLASLAGPCAVLLAAGGLGALHFAMDFRSMGGLCLTLAAATGLQMLPPRVRLWTLPCCLLATLGIASFLFGHVRSGDEMAHRSSRSDVERSAMLQATWEAFRGSPLIGQGSWFSRSDVYENFAQIRDDLAKEAGIGGFSGPNEEPETVGLHSQILVTLTEGGVFGASFFFVYGAGLLWALWDQVMVQAWRRERPIRVFVLVLAGWNLAMSPFSGAHRVYIALAVGLVLLVLAERHREGPA